MARRNPEPALGAILRELRHRAGWTVAETARRAKLSQGHITKLELGDAKPTAPALEKLAEALDCDSAILFRAAGLVPPAVADAFRETPELFLLVAGLPKTTRRRIYRELVQSHPDADPRSNPDWAAEERRRKKIKKRLLR